jgi:hypothetical protein
MIKGLAAVTQFLLSQWRQENKEGNCRASTLSALAGALETFLYINDQSIVRNSTIVNGCVAFLDGFITNAIEEVIWKMRPARSQVVEPMIDEDNGQDSTQNNRCKPKPPRNMRDGADSAIFFRTVYVAQHCLHWLALGRLFTTSMNSPLRAIAPLSMGVLLSLMA